MKQATCQSPASCAQLGERVADLVIQGLVPDYTDRVRFWAAVWDEIAPTLDMRPAEHARHLIEVAAIRPGMRVLDLGTGTGLCASMASALVGSDGQVIGVDISPEMLRLAAGTRPAANVHYRLMDAERLDFPEGSFDVVLGSMMLMTIPNPLDLLRSVRRVLTPGGRFAATTLVLGTSPRAELVRYLLGRLPGGLIDGLRLTDATARASALEACGFTKIWIKRKQYTSNGAAGADVEDTIPMQAFLAKIAEHMPLPDVRERTASDANPAWWIEFTSCIAP
jgi:SAM-dependent methyltransferase